MKKTLGLRLTKYFWTYIDSHFQKRIRNNSSSKKNILIIKFDGIGDFLLLIPHIQRLIELGYNVSCLGPSFQNEIIKHLGISASTYSFHPKQKRDICELISHLKAQNFHFAINTSMSFWGGIIVNRSNSNLKIGLLQEKENYVYKGASLFYDKKYSFDPKTHSFTTMELLLKDIIPEYVVKSQIVRQTTNGSDIVIHPYARWKPRQWPFYKELISELINQGHSVKLIGTLKEHASNEWLDCYKNSNMVDVKELNQLTDLMSIIESAKFFIGNDSGPAHYSALIGKKTYVLWGPGFFERIRPLGPNSNILIKPIGCRPCRQVGDTCKMGDNLCLKAIKVDDVINLLAFDE